MTQITDNIILTALESSGPTRLSIYLIVFGTSIFVIGILALIFLIMNKKKKALGALIILLLIIVPFSRFFL